MLFVFAALFFMQSAIHAQSVTMDTVYAQYLGTYKFPDGSAVNEIEISWADTILTITSDQGSAMLTKVAVDSFTMSAYDGIIAFKRTADNKVNQIYIYVMGMTLIGDKQAPTNGGTALRKEDVIEQKQKTIGK